MRAAGPTDKPLISFFQAKKERVKVSFLLTGCPFYLSITDNKFLPYFKNKVYFIGCPFYIFKARFRTPTPLTW